MKILYIVTESNTQGVQKYVCDIAGSVSSFFTEIAIAFGGEEEAYKNLLSHNKNISLHSFAVLSNAFNPLKELRNFYDLYTYIKKYKPSIIHVNKSAKVAGIVLVSRLCGVKKIIITLHGFPFSEERFFLTRFATRSSLWLSCLLVHNIVTLNKKDEFDIGRNPLLKRKVSTIYTGGTYDQPPIKRKKENRTVHLVSIAGLLPYKGLIYALSAVRLLVDKGYSVHYTIFGEGEQRKVLEDFIHMKDLTENVTLKGSVDNPSLFLNEYDIFVLPSLKEGLPYVLIQAGGAMLPVVASLVGGVSEIITHENTGLLVKPKDEIGLAKEIEKLISSKELSKTLARNLRERVVSGFSTSKMVAETMRLYGLM